MHALDAVGAWPPIRESHVEMDGAWALYEAWVALQIGEVDTALVYGFGKSSLGDLHEVMTLQLDPYYVAPLWPRWSTWPRCRRAAFLDATAATRRTSPRSPRAQRNGALEPARAAQRRRDRRRRCWRQPMTHDPLRKPTARRSPTAPRRSCSPPATWPGGLRAARRGSAASTTASSRTRSACATSTTSASTRWPRREAGVGDGPVDVAELHAPFTPPGADPARGARAPATTSINPSGGALGANPIMAAGLDPHRRGGARIIDGDGRPRRRARDSGPCLQQNLVCVLEGE